MGQGEDCGSRYPSPARVLPAHADSLVAGIDHYPAPALVRSLKRSSARTSTWLGANRSLIRRSCSASKRK